jgi:hypothetical protein
MMDEQSPPRDLGHRPTSLLDGIVDGFLRVVGGLFCGSAAGFLFACFATACSGAKDLEALGFLYFALLIVVPLGAAIGVAMALRSIWKWRKGDAG